MSDVTTYSGPRAIPPPPTRSPWRALLFAAVFALCVVAMLFALYADTRARMDDLRQPPLPACVLTPRTTCTVQSSAGEVTLAMGVTGQVWASTATATLVSPSKGRAP